MDSQGGYLRVLLYSTDSSPTVFARLAPEHVDYAKDLVEAVNHDRKSFLSPWHSATIDFVPLEGMKLPDRLRSETELAQANEWAKSYNWFEHRQQAIWDAVRALRKSVERCVKILEADRPVSNPEPSPPAESVREREREPGATEAAAPALTNSQTRVLQALARVDGSRLLSSELIASEMDIAHRLSERTIGPIVQRLVALGLAERPEGTRSGARLTPSGRRLASKIAD